jgi:iron complex outermembrane receptor protein
MARLATLLAFCACAQTPYAAAQGTPAAKENVSGQLEEIVVTAQRRAESVQNIPLAITAIDGSSLQSRSIQVPTDLQFAVPDVSVGMQFGVNRTYIRGIGLTSEALGADGSVAFYVNNVVIARPSAQLSAFYDVDRIEVLRGPQGTLYGRNATAGLVNVITRMPTPEATGYINVSYGNYQAVSAEGALSGPLDGAHKLLGRVAFQTLNRDGFGRNLTTGQDIDEANQRSVRGTLQYLFSDNVDVAVTGDYSLDRGSYVIHVLGPATSVPLTGVLLGGRNAGVSYNVYNDAPNSGKREQGGVLGVINARLGGAFSLKSLTSYRNFSRRDAGDIDGTDIFNATLAQTESSREFSEELQLNYEHDNLKAVAGGYYFNEDEFGDILTGLSSFYAFLCGTDPTCRFEERGTVKSDATALYAQATYEVIPSLKLTGGVRYSSETKHTVGTFHAFTLEFPTDDHKTWTAVTPKFGVDYSINDRVLLYASATKGFRAGVFNIGVPNPAINPETIWSYEAGFKARTLENRLQLNLAAFYYKYDNLQVGRIVETTPVIDNAASARNKGIELEIVAAVTKDLRIDASVSHLDAKFIEYSTGDSSRPQLGTIDLSGNTLPGAPDWSGTAGVEYKVPVGDRGAITFRADGSWRSKTYFTEFNVEPTSQAAYAKINTSLTFATPNDRWNVALYAKNLTNKMTIASNSIGATPLGWPRVGFLDPPRTYGVRVGYQF